MFSGKMGTGKDFFSDIFHKLLPKSIKFSFADQLKVLCMTERGLTFEECYIQKSSESRKVLQLVGTEEYRAKDPDIWIRYFINWVKVLETKGIETVIVSDCRFPNDISILRKEFKDVTVIRLIAPNRNEKRLRTESNRSENIYQSLKNHYSEIALDCFTDFDHIINNDIDLKITLFGNAGIEGIIGTGWEKVLEKYFYINLVGEVVMLAPKKVDWLKS